MFGLNAHRLGQVRHSDRPYVIRPLHPGESTQEGDTKRLRNKSCGPSKQNNRTPHASWIRVLRILAAEQPEGTVVQDPVGSDVLVHREPSALCLSDETPPSA